MLAKEGLNYSDYFDDNVPAEVKPPPDLLGPMGESDNSIPKDIFYPIQARDLFGNGLHEEKLPEGSWYWMDRKGEFIPVGKSPKKFGTRYVETPDIYEWAQKFLATNGIESDDNNALDTMYGLGFILVFVGGSIINYEYDPHKKPNQSQIKALLKASIDSNYHLVDKTKHETRRDSDKNKTYFTEGKRGKRIFILEHMMPQDTDTFKSHLAQLFQYLQKELQLKTVPKVKLIEDEKNADKVLGKTAYYDPDKRTIVLYATNRHQKDILRSFSHEVIHHWQHENERLQTTSQGGRKGEGGPSQDPQYAQKDPWLRQMEKQAYLLGNIIFRDWEDQKKAKDRQSAKTMVENSISQISPETPYGVIDSQTKKVVFRTIYANRNRARRFADKKDLEYGAHRYVPMVLRADYIK